LSRRLARDFGVPAILTAAFYVACANDPITSRDNGGAAGKGGSDASDAGETSNAGADPTSGSGGSRAGSAGASNAGQGGMVANGGKGGSTESPGGEAGMSAAGEVGAAGSGPIDECPGLTIGGKSKLPVPVTTGVAKPAGTPGGLSVLNWAGFKGAISFTFDDNLQSQVTHYAELNAVGVPMTFYLVGNTFAASKTTWATALTNGHELGNHTMHHCKVDGSQCGWGAITTVDEEIDNATTLMKTLLGMPDVYTFAAPNGDQAWSAPASERFILNRGVSDFATGVMPNDSITNAYNLPCHIASTNEKAVGGFNNITDDVRARGAWRIILAHNVDPTITDGGYQPVQLAEIVGAMTYAKNLTDVWVDTMVSIGAYWRAQKALTAAIVTTAGTSTTYSWTLPDHFPPGQFMRVKVDGGKLQQCGTELTWDDHGYYEVALDAGSVTIAP